MNFKNNFYSWFFKKQVNIFQINERKNGKTNLDEVRNEKRVDNSRSKIIRNYAEKLYANEF